MPYKYVPVAKEDTYKLIDAAQNGDRRARDLIVDQNIGLVRNLAMRYASGYYEPEDLMQVGFVGLVKAIDRFDTGYNLSLIHILTLRRKPQLIMEASMEDPP